MNPYIRETFGDPCRQCGFEWASGPAETAAAITAAPDRYRTLTAGRRGDETIAELHWDLTSYVCHGADNTRIWAERLAGPAVGAVNPIGPYDEVALAEARSYPAIELPTALWSLERAVGDWTAARALGAPGFRHPAQGQLSAPDAERIVAHELVHHAYDLQRIVGT
jgi:hypothetical protein